jgi:hypothetical protein
MNTTLIFMTIAFGMAIATAVAAVVICAIVDRASLDEMEK